MSAFYNEGLEGLLGRTIPSGAVIKCMGINEDYTYNAAHTYANIDPDHKILPEQPLAGVSFTNGYLNATDLKWFSANPPEDEEISGNLKGVILFFEWTDGGTNRKLLAIMDSAPVGLPHTLNGTNVTARWASQGILRIGYTV